MNNNNAYYTLINSFFKDYFVMCLSFEYIKLLSKTLNNNN